MAITEKEKRINIRVGVIISYISLAASIFYTLFFKKFILDSLSDEYNGLNNFATSITSWLSLLTFGLTSSYIRFATIAEKEKGEPGLASVNGLYLSLLLIASLLSWIIGGVIVALFFSGNIQLSQYDVQERTYLNYLILISVAQTSVSFLFGFFSLYNSYRNQFIFLRLGDLLGNVCSWVFVILALKRGGDVVVVSLITNASLLAVSIANCVYSFCRLRLKIGRFPWKTQWVQVKGVFLFSFWVFLNIIIDRINISYGVFILGVVENGKLVTIFSLGMEFYTYAGTMATAISANYIPQVNSLVVNNDREGVNTLFLKLAREQLAVLLLVVGGFAACGQAFIVAWLGSERIQVFYVALLLLIASLVPFSQSIGIEIQRAYNKHQFRSIAYTIMALFNILISTLLVYYLPYEYKVYGATAGTVLSLFVGPWAIMNVYYKKNLHLPILPYFKIFISLFLLSSVSVGLVYLVFIFVDLSSFNVWLVALFRGASFLVSYSLLIAIFYHKRIKAYFIKRKERVDFNKK